MEGRIGEMLEDISNPVTLSHSFVSSVIQNKCRAFENVMLYCLYCTQSKKMVNATRGINFVIQSFSRKEVK